MPLFVPTQLRGFEAAANAYGFKAWNFAVEDALSAGSAVAAGVMHLDRIEITAPITVSSLNFMLFAKPVTSANTYLAVYDSTGTRVGVTADVSATLEGYSSVNGIKTIALTGSLAMTIGFYWIGYVFGSAGTAPQFGRTNAFGANGGNLTGSARRCGDWSSGLSAAPTSFDPTSGTFTDSTRNTWWAVS